MRTFGFLLIMIAVLIPVALSVTLWDATGRASFTQIPSAALAKMAAESKAPDAFADLGMNDKAGEPTKVDNSFKFGLFPSGTGNNFADAASVATTAGPALLIVLVSCLMARTPGKKS